jgi:hypothetical protein
MPTAIELLSTEACDDILVVDLESRTIIIPKTVSVLGVESDDETRILHFHLPRYYCNVDLAEFAIRVHYKNAMGEPDMYIISNATVEDDLIKFDWVVGRHAFAKKGNVTFSVCLKDLFEGIVRREFNTTTATLPVLEGLETGYDLSGGHTDIFEQLREEYKADLDVESKDSGDVTDLLNATPGRYKLGNEVTGMPEDGHWWMVDVFSNNTNDATIVAHRIGTEARMYVKSAINSAWGEWHLVPVTNSDGELIMDGNIKGYYVTGEWLRTVAKDIHRTDAAEKIAVIDGGGWIYYRTPAELRSDMNLYSKEEVDAAIAAAIAKL